MLAFTKHKKMRKCEKNKNHKDATTTFLVLSS